MGSMQSELIHRSFDDAAHGKPFDGAPGTPGDPGQAAKPDASFGKRLQAERERRKISIASIAESTKILGALLEGLENDDVSRWPTGFYRRAFIRAYAGAIGLDPEPTVREFGARFPDPEDLSTAPPPAAITASAPCRAVLRLTLADNGGSFAGGDVLREIGRRLAAVAADAAVLGVIGAGLYLVVGAFWAPLTIAAAGYYFGGILVLGNTPGVCLVASRATAERGSKPGKKSRRFGGRAWAAGGTSLNKWRTSSATLWRAWLGR